MRKRTNLLNRRDRLVVAERFEWTTASNINHSAIGVTAWSVGGVRG